MTAASRTRGGGASIQAATCSTSTAATIASSPLTSRDKSLETPARYVGSRRLRTIMAVPASLDGPVIPYLPAGVVPFCFSTNQSYEGIKDPSGVTIDSHRGTVTMNPLSTSVADSHTSFSERS
jgi:hypothetical protein